MARARKSREIDRIIDEGASRLASSRNRCSLSAPNKSRRLPGAGA